MADTYTTALKARKIEQGAYANVYAARFNEDMVDVFDAAIAGTVEIDIGSNTTHSLEAMQNGTLSDSHYSHLRFVGTPASAVTVTVPASVSPSKEYRVENQTGQALTFKYAATAGVLIADGDTAPVRCDGTNVTAILYDTRHRATSAEVAAPATPTDLSRVSDETAGYTMPERYGAVGDGVADDTAAVQAAFDTGKNVLLRAVYSVIGLTLDTVGQGVFSFASPGTGAAGGALQRRGNGVVLTINESRVTMQNVVVRGASSGTPGTGNLVEVGDDTRYVRFLDCDMHYCSATNINAPNSHQITIRGGNYDNAAASAGTPPIIIGSDGLSDFVYYWVVDGITLQPSGNPLRVIGSGSGSACNSQLGGIDFQTGTFLSGSVSNRVTGNRITGPISDEGSSTAYVGNVVGAHAITFTAASSGIMWVGNVRGSGSSITDSGSGNIIIESDQTTGLLSINGQMQLYNNKFTRYYNAAFTNYGSIGMTAGGNLTLENRAGSLHLAASVGNQVQLIVDGVESVRADKSATATHTRLMVYDVDNATLERVTVGAADSGGVGFKLLRIPN